MNRCVLLAALVALCLQPLFAADDSSRQQEATKLIEQAVAKANIFQLPSFQIKANVQILSMGKPMDGSYQLLWNGPEQWREDIQFPGYAEVQVGGKGSVWIQRSLTLMANNKKVVESVYPLSVYFLHVALGFGSGAPGGTAGPTRGSKTEKPVWSLVQFSLSERDKVTKIREEKNHGEAQTCIDFQNEDKPGIPVVVENQRFFEVCVSKITNTLVRGVVRGSGYVDMDFQPVGGGKVFPRFLSSVADDGTTLAKATVTVFRTPVQFPPNLFAPPAGVSPHPGCMNPTPFRLIKGDPPGSGHNGFVFDSWIGVDGVPRAGRVVVGGGPGAFEDRSYFEKSSIDAIKTWRYEPAKCDGQPVEIETFLQDYYGSLSLWPYKWQ